jgi:hypothetical protein
MCKSVEIFYKDSSAPLNEAGTGREGHELLHEGLCPDIRRRTFLLLGNCSARPQKQLCKNHRVESNKETQLLVYLEAEKENHELL